ncbi:MAG: hypothetical protein ACI4N3_01590, partial [Alphaproteobacteria bacterium]
KITGALDGSMTIDNRVFSGEGRAEIVKQHEEIGDNLVQIGSGLRNNIVVKAIENAITDKTKDLIDTIADYVKQDRQMTELQEKRRDLVVALNGMTDFDSPEAQAILQQVADFVAEGGGFSGDLKLANVDGNIIGFAYQSNDSEVKNITLNMANIDMSDPKALMNALYHETTNFEEHNANEITAKNRGDTGAGIFGLKNYGNENTNGMGGDEWLESHSGEDTIREGSLGLISDLHNTMTGEGRGDGFILTGLAIAASIYSIQDSARKIYAWFDGEGYKGKTTYVDPINGKIYTAEGNLKEGATDLIIGGGLYVGGKAVNKVGSKLMSKVDDALDIDHISGIGTDLKYLGEAEKVAKPLPKTGTNFFVDSSGQVFPVPENYTLNLANNGKGVILEGGTIKGTQVDMRIMNPVEAKNNGKIPAYPNGYVKYSLPKSNAGIDPYTLKQIDEGMKGHFSIKIGD